MKSAEQELEGFIEKYSPEVAQSGREVLAKMRKIVPPCIEMVYDNYNWLVVGFCPNKHPMSAVFSVIFAPRWITLCFLQGAGLQDPQRLLQGEGKVVRSVRLGAASDLDKPEMQNLMELAMASAKVPYPADQERSLVIKSVSAKQRSRRP